jgi:nucleotide-binding universal stress UspA family protein
MLGAALFESGRPLVLVGGRAMTMPRRVVVGWDNSPAAVRAMTAALPLLRRAEVVVVAQVDEGGTGQRETGATAAGYLARHGIAATFHAVPRGKGEVFADLAGAAAGLDLLVCGAVRRSRAQDVLFGGVTGAILSGAVEMPVLLMA